MSAPQPLQETLKVDLVAGRSNCPAGAWSGSAEYTLPELGTVQFRGTGFGCQTQGFGLFVYPDGAMYFGGVGSLVRGQGRAALDEMRPLVREGKGIYIKPGGRTEWGGFSRDRLVDDRLGQVPFIQAWTAAMLAFNRQPVPAMGPELAAFLQWGAAAGAGTAGGPAVKPATEAASSTASPVTGTRAPATAVALDTTAAATRAANAETAGAAPSVGRVIVMTPPAPPSGPATAATALRSTADTGPSTITPRTPPAPARVAGPLEVPVQIARLPGVARLVQAVALYGKVDTPIVREDWDTSGFYWKCKAPDGADAEWTNIYTVFAGQHRECYPRGLGRTRDNWVVNGKSQRPFWIIGELRAARVNDCGLLSCEAEDAKLSVEPAGLVEIRWDNGLRQFLEIEMGDPPKSRPSGHLDPEGDSRVTRVLGSAWPDGTVLVNDQRGNWHGRYGTGQSLKGTLHRPDGWTAQATFKGTAFNSDAVTWRSPDGGVQAAVKTASYSGGEQALSAWLQVQLTAPWQALPAGRYRLAGNGMRLDDVPRQLAARWRALQPADAATLAVDVTPPPECTRRPDLVPAGWTVWWPACSVIGAAEAARADIPAGGQRLSIWNPELNRELRYVIGADGQVAMRVLEEFGLTRESGQPAGPSRSWSARAMSLDDGVLRIDGEGDLRTFDTLGRLATHYRGPFAGLNPDGQGLCGKPEDEGGGTEPCSYTVGQRNDEVHRLRQQRYALAAERQALQDRQDSERREREAASARRRAEQDERAEQQARADRRRKADEESAAFHASMMGAISGLKQTFKQGAEDMAASNRRAQALVDQANEAARQKQRQQDAGPPPGTYNAAKEAEAQRAYERQRAQQRADLDAERARQAQQSRQQGAALQAQANAVQRQNPGSYVSPYETGRPAATASVSGSPVPTECMKEVKRRFGGHCNKDESVTVFVQNVCQTPIDIRICIDTPQGETCETNLARPGATVSMWQCQLSGSVRFSGSNPR